MVITICRISLPPQPHIVQTAVIHRENNNNNAIAIIYVYGRSHDNNNINNNNNPNLPLLFIYLPLFNPYLYDKTPLLLCLTMTLWLHMCQFSYYKAHYSHLCILLLRISTSSSPQKSETSANSKQHLSTM
jgi:hypothetical protein